MCLDCFCFLLWMRISPLIDWLIFFFYLFEKWMFFSFFLNRYVLDVYNREKYCLFIFLFFNQFPGRKTPCVFFYNFFFVHKKKRIFSFFVSSFSFILLTIPKQKPPPSVWVFVCHVRTDFLFSVCVSRGAWVFLLLFQLPHTFILFL